MGLFLIFNFFKLNIFSNTSIQKMRIFTRSNGKQNAFVFSINAHFYTNQCDPNRRWTLPFGGGLRHPPCIQRAPKSTPENKPLSHCYAMLHTSSKYGTILICVDCIFVSVFHLYFTANLGTPGASFGGKWSAVIHKICA